MGIGLKRTDLQANALGKIDDAIILLRHGRHSNAYYLEGYAIELALKACIAAQIVAETIPDRSLMKNVISHDLKGLLGIAGLSRAHKDESDRNAEFAGYWAYTVEWSPESRYEAKDIMSAQYLIQAIKDGARLRLRPKVMTVATIVASLLPIMWSTRTGAEVMKPLATPVIGGMVSSLIHILIVTPVIFAWLRERELRRDLEKLPATARTGANQVLSTSH